MIIRRALGETAAGAAALTAVDLAQPLALVEVVMQLMHEVPVLLLLHGAVVARLGEAEVVVDDSGRAHGELLRLLLVEAGACRSIEV